MSVTNSKKTYSCNGCTKVIRDCRNKPYRWIQANIGKVAPQKKDQCFCSVRCLLQYLQKYPGMYTGDLKEAITEVAANYITEGGL